MIKMRKNSSQQERKEKRRLGRGGQWRAVAIAQRTSTRQVGYATDTGVLLFL